MAQDLKLNVSISGDFKSLERSLKNLQGEFKSLGSSITQTGRNLTNALGILGTGAFFGKITKDASDAEETINKFNVVFSDVAQDANKAANDLANNFGLSANAAKQLLSDTGDLLTGFGFSGEAALQLSNNVQELAVDLASFTNFSGGAEGASAALTKALLGETESLKSLGIAISQDAVAKKVQELATQGVIFATERQAKAQATLLLATEQSKNAVGDFARSQDSFANQTRILLAQINDLSVELGKVLLPIATRIASELSKVVRVFKDSDPVLKTLTLSVVAFGAALGPVLIIVGQSIIAFGALSGALSTLVLRLKTLVLSLNTLRGALIATGVGALIVGVGILIDQFLKFSERVGGVKNAFTLLNLRIKIFVVNTKIAFTEAIDSVGNFTRSILGLKKSAESFSLRKLRAEAVALKATYDGLRDVFANTENPLGGQDNSSNGNNNNGNEALSNFDSQVRAIVGNLKTAILEAETEINNAEFAGKSKQEIDSLRIKIQDELKPQVKVARDELIRLYNETGNQEALEQANALTNQIKQFENSSKNTKTQVKSLNEELKDSAPRQAASGLVNAFDSLAQGSKNAKDAFSDFASSFLRQISNMILQSLILQSIQSALPGASGVGGSAATGGLIGGTGITNRFAEGGQVTGPGTGTSDSIVARLSNGEFVSDARTVGFFGPSFFQNLKRISRGQFQMPAFNQGGFVGMATGSEVLSQASGGTIEIRNSGQPKEVSRTITREEAQGTVTTIFLEDLERNGPINRALSRKGRAQR